MSHKVVTAKIALANIVGNGANVAAVGAGGEVFARELGQTHLFLYLNLPIWVFFILTVVLAAIGSVASLYVDVMKEARLSYTQKFMNLVMGFLAGLIGAFIILPTFVSSPTMAMLMFTGLCSGFAGTLLVFNLGEAIRSTELWDGLRKIFTTFTLNGIKTMAMSRLRLLAAWILKGGDK